MDSTIRTKPVVHTLNEVTEGIQFGSMKYSVEMVLDGMTYILSFMKISSCILVILRLLPRQCEGLQYWYYSREGFGLENRDYGRRGSAALTTRHPSNRKSWH
jgi:hypothetical protein